MGVLFFECIISCDFNMFIGLFIMLFYNMLDRYFNIDLFDLVI